MIWYVLYIYMYAVKSSPLIRLIDTFITSHTYLSAGVWESLSYILLHSRVVSHFSHVQLFASLWTVAPQAPLSLGFSRQEYWSGLPCPSPGDLPDPEIKPRAPTLQADSLPAELQGKPLTYIADLLTLNSKATALLLMPEWSSLTDIRKSQSQPSCTQNTSHHINTTRGGHFK